MEPSSRSRRLGVRLVGTALLAWCEEPLAFIVAQTCQVALHGAALQGVHGLDHAEVRAEGVACSAGYIPVPVYKLPYFQSHGFFAGRWPVKELGLTAMDYTKVKCPEAEAILTTGISCTLNESMDEAHVREVAAAVRKVAKHYAA